LTAESPSQAAENYDYNPIMTVLALRPRLLRLLLPLLILAFTAVSGSAFAGPKPASGQFLTAATLIGAETLQDATLHQAVWKITPKPAAGCCVAAEGGLTTAEQLTAAAGRAVGTVGPGSGSVYGTLVHSAFSDEVINLGDSNLSSEISYLNGEVVPYGTSGSVRLDVVEGPLDAPTSIFDLKTGSATLTPGRILQIQNNIPGGTSVPVFPITPP